MLNRTEQEIMKNWKGDLSKPLVSVCTITYNHEKYIAEAIDGFLMQETNFPFEILIDDDCSPDNTAEIVKEYQNKYPNIIKARLRDKNVGAMVNFIENMSRANSRYIALCEGDDYWIDSQKLQIQINEMKKYPDVNISFHPAYELIDGKKRNVLAGHSKENKIFTTSEVILGDGGFMPTASLVVKKEIVDNLPEWFHKDAPVGDYFIQIFGAKKAGALYINRVMGIYRIQHIESWSHSIKNENNKIMFVEKMQKVMKNLDEELNHKYFSEIEQWIKKYAWGIILNRNISIQAKKPFYNKNRTNYSTKQKLQWFAVFSNPNVDKILRFFYDIVRGR